MSSEAGPAGRLQRDDSSLRREGATKPQVLAAPEGGAGLSPTLPEAVTEFCSWPRRTAVLLDDHSHDAVVDALRRVGFATVLVPPSVELSRLAAVDPSTFILVGPETLDRRDGLEVLRTLRELNPVARILLLALADVAAPSTLLAAIRAGVHEVVDPLDQLALRSVLRAQLAKAGQHRERVLAVGAHPDDIEIGCGATLMEHRRQGDRISMLTLSRGSVGGSARDRTKEALAAASMIGAQLLLADLPDTRVSDGIDTIRLIEQVVLSLAPTIVYVHSPHDNHQDHRAVHAATLSAARGVPTVMAYQSPSASNAFLPTAFVPVDRTILGKHDVLACHASQAERSYMEPEAVTSAARYWARNLGAQAKYAEPFELVRAVSRVAGPVEA